MSDSKNRNAILPRRNFLQKAAAGFSVAALGGVSASEASAAKPDRHWDLSADVVVVGSGAAGLPASIAAAEAGASVIVVEQNYDVGGHAVESGGNVTVAEAGRRPCRRERGRGVLGDRGMVCGPLRGHAHCRRGERSEETGTT